MVSRRAALPLVALAVVVILVVLSRGPDGFRLSTPAVDRDESTEGPRLEGVASEAGLPSPGPASPTGEVSGEVEEPTSETAGEEVLVRVRVVDEEGRGVQDVGIREITKGDGGPLDLRSRTVGRTDDQGRAVVRVDPSARLGIDQSPEWHANRGVPTLPPSEEEAVIVVVPQAVIRGQVVGESGAPLQGVRVLARVRVRSQPGRTATQFVRMDPTDEDGRFTAAFPRYAEEAVLSVNADGAFGQLRFDPVRTKDVVLRVLPLVWIEGEVVRGDGAPLDLPDERMPLVHAEAPGSGESARGSFVGGTSRFRIRVPEAGRYRVSVQWPREHPGVLTTPPAQMVDAPTATDLRFVCRDGRRLSARLEGDDVAGFDVAWVRREPRGEGGVKRHARTGEDGRFVLEGLADGDTLLYVFREGDPRYALVRRPPLGGEELTLPLEKGLMLAGTVVRYPGAHGFPLRLQLVWEGPAIGALVEEDGTFRFDGLPPGRYGLRWSRGTREGSLEVELDAGNTSVELTVPQEVLDIGTIRAR